jgi:hypothetical protein
VLHQIAADHGSKDNENSDNGKHVDCASLSAWDRRILFKERRSQHYLVAEIAKSAVEAIK